MVDIAQRKSVQVRILGSLAVRIHSEPSAELFSKLGRLGNTDRVFTDIDFAAYSKQKGKLRGVLEDEMKLEADIWSLLHMKDRIMYRHPNDDFKVDVFFDRLNYSHEVSFGSDPKKGRLALDFPTITLADIMLEKLQIHQINEKDVKDVIVLLHEHVVGLGQDKEMIDAKYVASVLANDWGFWYDASANLEKIRAMTSEYVSKGLLTNDVAIDIQRKIDRLRKYIDEEPKSKNWISRGKNGTKKQWWNDVEEVSR
jgi:hypothetical protein